MIKYYSYSNIGAYEGISGVLEDEYQALPVRSTIIPPPSLEDDEVAYFHGDGWFVGKPIEEQPSVAQVPASITMRQARLQLHAIGKLTAVQDAINKLPEPPKTLAQIEWDYAAVVERASPFVALMTPALGLSDEEMDELFIQASKL